MILLEDTVYYHQDGHVRVFKAGDEAPGEGWQKTPFPGVALRVAPDPFDHDGDGRPGGSLKGGNRRKKAG